MNIQHPVRITGVGKYTPENVVTSAALEHAYGIEEGLSEKYSGVLERRVATDETNGSMGAIALNMALDHAGIKLEELDMLISGSATFDYIIPNQASVILSELGGSNGPHIPCTDVNTTCLGFITAFDFASSMMDGKRFRKIGIVNSEIATKGLNPDVWETFTLFGDGAAAAVLEYDGSGKSGVIKAGMKTYPEGTYTSMIKGGGNRYFFKGHPYDQALHSFYMEGKNLLRLASKVIPSYVDGFFEDLEMEICDVDLIVPHQASKAGLGLFEKMYKVDPSRVISNLKTFGNCISASVPMCLYDAIEEGKLNRGQTCLIIGTSAGFAIGSVLFKF